jgi:transglutaminase-like putative cysteine protease
VDQVSGRTIQPDGTIVPFTGKPFDKLVEKRRGSGTVKAKVFTLPDVRVGSIIEYRYKLFFDDTYVNAPDWYLQQDYFVRKAHFRWLPTDRDIENSRGAALTNIAWMPILPVGAKVEKARDGAFELSVSNLMPLTDEDFSPPLKSVSMRVLFYYTGYRSSQEFWDKEGKRWAKEVDDFVGPGKGVKAATQALISPGDSDEQKLRKIYAAVMALDNTRWSRVHTSTEDRAQGLKLVKSTDDVLDRKRGSDDQLTMLFVAMARAAGFKAYVGSVADRNKRLFVPGYLSFSQLDDYVAIVNVGGKEEFFDPGQRYCTYGQMAWQHAPSNGLRQTDGGSMLFTVPTGPYKDNRMARQAVLRVDETGAGSGGVVLTISGNGALAWRHEALEEDESALSASLKSYLEARLPAGTEVTVGKIANLTDPDKPLIINYDVKGQFGSPTGKRLLLPAQFFESTRKPRFTSAKRENPVDFGFATATDDAVLWHFPANMKVDSAPPAVPERTMLRDMAAYRVLSKQQGSTLTTIRNLSVGNALFMQKDYPELKAFYEKVEAKDQDSVVLVRDASAAAGTGGSL